MKGLDFLTANSNSLKNQSEQEALDEMKPMENPNIPRTPREDSPASDRAKNSVTTVLMLVFAIGSAIWGVGYFTGEKVFSFQKGGE